MKRALALVASAWLVTAADPPSPPAAEPASPPSTAGEKLAAARDLMTAMHAQANASAMLHGLHDVLVREIQQRNSLGQEAVGKLVDEVLMPEIDSRVGELMDLLAGVQAEFYTVDELHQLKAFYESPLGQRVIEMTPKIGASSFAIGQEWGQRVATDAIRKHAEELRNRGLKL